MVGTKTCGIILIMAILFLPCCSDDVEDTYANYAAFFVCTTVSTIPQLSSALNGWGMFITIRYSGGKYLFTDESGNCTTINPTALTDYSSFVLGLSGFIVGLPNVPELGSDTSTPVCFDLACPNCYEEFSIARNLSLGESGFASCSLCERTYDLNNLGIVSDGDGGISLLRYHISYSGNTMVINN